MSFEITARAAAGRIGRFETPHGPVTTPTLMPVVNPNIALVSPQEMKDRFGAEMVITNSYVIQKHEALRRRALDKGVHEVLGWDGALMTDSGTFQMYVYGDVDVGPDEIVDFQARMGVDVATCLDIFVTPDMTRPEAEAAVATTIERARSAVAHKGGSLLNATVQGGIHTDLREACATAYRDLDVDYHTIGGVVPLMERQMYPELVQAILAAQRGLRKDRPVHLFGAGHPLVFPMAVALGCDLFDSSSYAKYARDGRIMTPEATLHVEDAVTNGEWPFSSRFLDAWTPKEVAAGLGERRRADAPGDAEVALAKHNLDVCFADLRRIRTHIREGTLWELVEQRAACHPLLAAATRTLGEPAAQAWLEAREPTSGTKALRYTGPLTHRRPVFARVRHRLATRFTPVGVPAPSAVETPYAQEGEEKLEAAMHKEPANKPYGDAIGSALDPDQDHFVISPLGPVPLGLDEAYPFAQSVLPRLEGLDREHMGWVGTVKDELLAAHDMMPAIPGPPGPSGPGGHGGVDRDLLQVLRTADWQFGAGAGRALTDGDLRCGRSRRTGKMRTVHLDGEHVLSLRAADGLWTLKPAGARILHEALPAPACRVVVDDDSVAFNRDGKSVFAKFVERCDPDLRPGDECLVVDGEDRLVAVGRALLCAEEMADFQTGMAVKVRDGIAPPDAGPAGVAATEAS